MRYDFAGGGAPAAPEALAATSGPAPTPHAPAHPDAGQPVPTDGQWIALVTGIDDDSLEPAPLPDLSGEIVLRLYKNQWLLVLSARGGGPGQGAHRRRRGLCDGEPSCPQNNGKAQR